MIVVAVAALLPIAGAAVAGEGDKMKQGAKFDTLDTNRDGKISKSEAAADSTIVFTSADANGDGYLDASEYSKAHKSTDSGQQPYSSPEAPPRDLSEAPPADTETPRQ
jgi:hypothetical protein